MICFVNLYHVFNSFNKISSSQIFIYVSNCVGYSPLKVLEVDNKLSHNLVLVRSTLVLENKVNGLFLNKKLN